MEQGASCPSGRCREGALLIGIVRSDGTVGYLGGPVEVDAQFVAVAHQGRAPETRFRFSEPCAQGTCRHWGGDACTLVDQVLELDIEASEDPALPRCGIRRSCVWFAQRGRDACAVCPQVIHTRP
jgi:hypothetical protein